MEGRETRSTGDSEVHFGRGLGASLERGALVCPEEPRLALTLFALWMWISDEVNVRKFSLI